MSDHRNTNGLVNGCIPAGKACPWADGCRHLTGHCPTQDKRNNNEFSCALARLHSLIKIKGYDGKK